jgi:peptide deformylase
MTIIKKWNKILRKTSNKIVKFNNIELKNIIINLKNELSKNNWVWIAAPQIWISKSIFIIHSSPNERYPYAPNFCPIEIINPKIIKYFKETNKDWEWCLSIPWIRWLVKRFEKIKVEYQNIKWKKKEKIFEWFLSRIFQHEYDHLEWILFIDKLKEDELFSEKEYLNIIKK